MRRGKRLAATRRMVSIDEKPVRRCALIIVILDRQYTVSIDEKPVRRCAVNDVDVPEAAVEVSIDEKPVRRCASHAAKSLKNK